MKYRNISALLLALVMVLSLAACGSKEEVPVDTAAVTENAPASTETVAPATSEETNAPEAEDDGENVLLRGHDGTMEIAVGPFTDGMAQPACRVTVPTDALFSGYLQLSPDDGITLESKSLADHQAEMDFSTTVLGSASFSMEQSSIGILAYELSQMDIASARAKYPDGTDLQAAFPAYVMEVQPDEENPEHSVQVVVEMDGRYTVVISYTGEFLDSMEPADLGSHLVELLQSAN